MSRDEFIKEVKERNPDVLTRADITEEEVLLALDYWPKCLRYSNIQTPSICLKSVISYGLSLKYVKEQTEEICVAAVKQDWNALKFVKEEFKEAAKNALKGKEPAIVSAQIYCGGRTLHGILVYEKTPTGGFWGIAPIVNGVIELSNTFGIQLNTLNFIRRDENFFNRGLYDDWHYSFYSFEDAFERINSQKRRYGGK